MFRAYFDESGTAADSTITAIAGYVATNDTWTTVEELWREELRLLADKGIKTFHMSQCIAGEGEYAFVDEFHRHAHIKRLSQILRDTDLYAIGAWVDNADWDAVVKDPHFLVAFPKPYHLCLEQIVHSLRGWSRRKAGGRLVVPMFAYHPEYSPRTSRVYGSKKSYQDVMAPLEFDYPKHVLPLQAADFIANQVRYDAHHVGYDELTLKNMGVTLAFENATAKHGAHMILGYTEQGLELAIKTFIDTGEIF